MKLYISLVALGLIILAGCTKEKDISPAQADNFLKMYGGYNVNEGYDLKQTVDGGYIITGKTMISEQNEDLILIKTDKFGNLEWEKIFDVHGGNDVGNSVQIDIDGGYIILGTCTNTSEDTDMLLLKVSANGDSLWTMQYDRYQLNQEGKSLIINSEGGYVLLGSTEVSGVEGIHDDIYLLKVDASGTVIWEDTDGSSFGDDNGSSIIENHDGRYMVIGRTKLFPVSPGDNSFNMYVTISSPVNGIIVNSCTYGKMMDDNGIGLIKSDGTNYVMVGNISDNGANKIYVRKFGNDQISGLQDSIWVRSFSGAGHTYAGSVSETADKGAIIIGSDISGSNSDIYLIKVDPDGNEVFSASFGGEKSDEGNAVIETQDNGFAIVGTTEYDNRSMICLIKTDANGNL